MWHSLGLDHIAEIFRNKHVNIETYDGDALALKTSLYLDGDIITQTRSPQISPELLSQHQQQLNETETRIQQNLKRALTIARAFIFSFALVIAIALGKINEIGDELIHIIVFNLGHLIIGGLVSWIGGILIERFIRSKLSNIM